MTFPNNTSSERGDNALGGPATPSGRSTPGGAPPGVQT